MKGSETKMTAFMEGADKRFVIPVYQRKYDWKIENCRQLYNDLKKIVFEKRESHFFGSIVSSVEGNGGLTEYHIIDGQQRLTTVSLLLLAICNLIKSGQLKSQFGELNNQILQRFLISPWVSEDDKIKLRPVKSDKESLRKLFGDEVDYDISSKLTHNYKYFCDVLLSEEISVDDLFAAVGKLEIISITLDKDDNAQLIFESLNSTGLALSEGDKIRNYILMGQSSKEQNRLYDDYWTKIEKCTQNDVSAFIRDYLSIKQQKTPTISKVYIAFKQYFENAHITIEELLSNLLKYARFYEKLLTCNSGLNKVMLDDCLYRMKRLDITVTRPFFLEVFRLNNDGKLLDETVERIFLITENYLFRRNICDVPTNALNKIFLTMNKDILRYDDTTDDYVDKYIYTLLARKESGRFPDDDEFKTALENKQVYLMRGKYKAYLFERFENYGTVESKDVYTHLDNNVYTIEHIMPQKLNPDWIKELGENYLEIHSKWLHRLANLTLTGYNPNLSNKSFKEKRDSDDGGYIASGLKMNQKIAKKEKWSLDELKERNEEMVSLAKTIWDYPCTSFVPIEREYDSCTLDDEDIELTGRELEKYSYQDIEHSVTSWSEMYENIIKYLHGNDKSVLAGLSYEDNIDMDLSRYFSTREDTLRKAIKVDDGIYLEMNTSTSMKISILRRLFALYDEDPMDLVFYLKDSSDEKKVGPKRYEVSKRYWEYSLPMIKEKNFHDGRASFVNVEPAPRNTISGYFGIRGFSIKCIANKDLARVEFYMGNNSTSKNKKAYDKLFENKAYIESKLGIRLEWDRADESKASSISYSIGNVGLYEESTWSTMRSFHAEWSDKLCDVLLPFLKEIAEKDLKRTELSLIFQEWSKENDYIDVDISKCNLKYTRFKTKFMSELLPDISNAPSGWNTDNHYFYEIITFNGERFRIQLSISSRNVTDEFLYKCKILNDLPMTSNKYKDGWEYWIPFKTSNKNVDDDINKEKLHTSLNECLEEIKQFEMKLKEEMERYYE